jgi:Carboxypeptidase regulatory-like domain
MDSRNIQRCSTRWLQILAIAVVLPIARGAVEPSWTGVLRDSSGFPVANATVTLHSGSRQDYSASTPANGEFAFAEVAPGSYEVSVSARGETYRAANKITLRGGIKLALDLRLGAHPPDLLIADSDEPAATHASGGEHLSGGEVSSLPLNARDFSKLLLLAAGTMTDANGAANFTQQFAVNGQRGSTTVFALDGADTTDSEMGGATFSNFNVDAIQEVQSSSGVMPAEIGHGAAGYTNVVTRSGTNDVHGSVFEFLRNAAFDARNFFDHKSVANESRIPPFVRNEFGFTNGGPVVFPKIYNGRDRTFYFAEYQGFRQVLGTTQVFPVPTAMERQGIDTATFPGDSLTVPVNPAIQPVLAKYPLPNEPQGPYGARTYAASSKVRTRTDQFSIRVDHKISDKSNLFARFSLNQVTGPTNNPDQTAIDPSFGVQFFDHQRNAGIRYTRTITPHFTWETSLGYIRSTPFFPPGNLVQPALGFGDGLFQGFDAPGGSIFGSYGNLYQFKQDMTAIHGAHAFKWGAEIRVNRDSTIFGVGPNGSYTFGGGTAYSPVDIPSASGTHDIHVGDPLPDSLTGLLTATPFSYNSTIVSDITPRGNRFDEAGVRREAYNFYFQDTWKITPRISLNYGLRYEVNSRIHEATRRTSLPEFVDANGNPAPYWDHGAKQLYVVNPQPPYEQDWRGWGPRLALDYGVSAHTVAHVGAAITTILPNLWQDNFLTAAVPFSFGPFVSARPGVPVPFQNSALQISLPPAYTPQGAPVIPNGRTEDIAPNTIVDLDRLEQDLAALTPGNQPQLLGTIGIARNFRNGYIASYTAAFDHDFHDVRFSAAYVGTVGIHLPEVYSPNSYGGAEPQFAPYTRFDSADRAIGGLGAESLMTSESHSSYHSMQTSVSKNSPRAGLGLQVSYTFSKSLDDTSSVLGGLFGTAGVVLQTLPQNPWDPSVDKGPSTFDVTHVFTASVIQLLPLERVSFLRPIPRRLTAGWQFLNITTLMSGPPFSVFSGVQQTGVGTAGADRPDLLTQPHFSTGRAIREDYFGLGASNASFFFIPIALPVGTGPNQGRFGTLGRNTFRGPGLRNFDVALIKDTPFGRRGNGEFATLEFRAEFFNIFNIVNFGLPSNIVRGSGFGLISKTAGPSRQIQFSLKLIY